MSIVQASHRSILLLVGSSLPCRDTNDYYDRPLTPPSTPDHRPPLGRPTSDVNENTNETKA